MPDTLQEPLFWSTSSYRGGGGWFPLENLKDTVGRAAKPAVYSIHNIFGGVEILVKPFSSWSWLALIYSGWLLITNLDSCWLTLMLMTLDGSVMSNEIMTNLINVHIFLVIWFI